MDVKIFNVPKACARNGEKRRKGKKKMEDVERFRGNDSRVHSEQWHIVKVYLKEIPKGVYTYIPNQ